MSSEQLIRNLETPRGTVDAILNTDAYNEVDDQFALAYMLLSRERIRTLGICAAPFLNRKRTSPADGMRKNHEEILQVLELMEQTPKPTVYMGVERFLVGEGRLLGLLPPNSSCGRRCGTCPKIRCISLSSALLPTLPRLSCYPPRRCGRMQWW